MALMRSSRHVLSFLIAGTLVSSTGVCRCAPPATIQEIENASRGNDQVDRQKKAQEERAADLKKKDAIAARLAAEWNQGRVTSLKSTDLPAAVCGMRSEGCLRVSTSAPAIHRSDLRADQSADLDTAITGLLTAFGKVDPAAVLGYVHERGEQFDDTLEQLLKKQLLRRGQTDLDGISGDELFTRWWKILKINGQWRGLVADSSCLQIWDGKLLSFEQITNFDTEDPTSPAAVLFGIFRGSSTHRHHFVPTKGSLADALKNDRLVLLVDVKLIIEFDKKKPKEKAAYLCRFWFNPSAGKWQPISLIGFASHPEEISLPDIIF